jgi:hypothetical protein
MRSISIVHAAVAVAIVALVLALPALASASLYCVNEPACVKAGGSSEGSEGVGLQKALTSAEGHAGSTVEIGPGTYSRAKGFDYTGVPVAIRGAGAGSTILTTPLEAGGDVFALNSASATLSDVSVEIAAGEGQRGIELRAGTVEHVSVSGGAGKDIPTGLAISGGVFADGSIEMSEAETTTGVSASGGEVIGSTITASYGVDASVATTVRGCRISAHSPIEAYGANLIIEDTLLDLRGSEYWGVGFAALEGNSVTATLRGLTIVNGGSGSVGLEVRAYDPETKATHAVLALEDSIISHVTHPIVETASEADATVAATSDYSSYETAEDLATPENGGATPTLSDANPVSTAPDFINAVFGAIGFAEGNWALLASSPLLGAARPSALAAGEYAFDAAGNPRIVDGARDVGAYEYQRTAPVVSATGTSLTVEAGVPVSFSGSASVIEPGDAIDGYQWTFDDGASVPAGATATHAFATAGTHTATLTATDVVGVKGTAVVSVVVTARPPLPPVCKCGRPQPITSLSIAPHTFRAALKGASIAGATVGARVGFKLSAEGHVTFTVKRVLAGVAHGRSCVAPAHGSTHGKRCTRDVPVRGSFAHAGVAGANSLRFSGRVHGHALAPGSYLLIATYSGDAGRASASAPFHIVG